MDDATFNRLANQARRILREINLKLDELDIRHQARVKAGTRVSI